MGTISEWLSVLVWGGLWGSIMAWTTARRGPAIFNLKGRVQHFVTWLPAGLLFGIMTTFHWHRAVHRPLLFVTLAATAGLFLMGLIFRNATRH
ncbi:MAG: hypothetical protein ABSG70_13145 [Terriglobales bacterium]|jgi:hypothetical protein